RVDPGHDLLLDIGHDADLAQIDADGGEVVGDIADVLVLGPAGQDLVTDDEDRRGHPPLRFCRHASLPRPALRHHRPPLKGVYAAWPGKIKSKAAGSARLAAAARRCYLPAASRRGRWSFPAR